MQYASAEIKKDPYFQTLKYKIDINLMYGLMNLPGLVSSAHNTLNKNNNSKCFLPLKQLFMSADVIKAVWAGQIILSNHHSPESSCSIKTSPTLCNFPLNIVFYSKNT